MSVDETQVSADALEVTDAALSTVLEVRSEEDNPESTALRVAITGSNGPEFTYDLSFEDIDEARPEDHKYQVNELTVMQGGLVIRNPNRPKMLEGEDIELTGTPGQKLQQLLDTHINPSLAAHSGYAELVKMDGTVAHILMGGGCQGCAMSAATLRQGIEVMIAEAIPEITEIVDVTDHEAGENPFFE